MMDSNFFATNVRAWLRDTADKMNGLASRLEDDSTHLPFDEDDKKLIRMVAVGYIEMVSKDARTAFFLGDRKTAIELLAEIVEIVNCVG